MTEQQQQVRDWMLSVGQSCPSKPTIPSLEVRKLRAKLILEEALETIEALGCKALFSDKDSDEFLFRIDLEYCKFSIVESNNFVPIQLNEIADGCEDLKIVTEGTLVACGLLGDYAVHHRFDGYDPLFSAVMRSNFSKFLTPDEFSQQVESNSSNPNWLPHTVYTDDTKQTIKYIVVKDTSGKVMKGPSYSAPNLQPIIDEMSK